LGFKEREKMLLKAKTDKSKGFKFKLADMELTKIINQLPLYNLNDSVIYDLCELLVYDYFGDFFVVTEENAKIFNIAMEENPPVVDSISFLTGVMNIYPFLPSLFHISLSIPVGAIQILLAIDKNDIVRPVKLRLNEEVKGELIAMCHLSINNMSMKLKEIETKIFALPKDDKTQNHITIFPNYSDKQEKKPLVFWHLAFKDKTETSIDEIILLTSAWDTEEDFLKRAKNKGVSISNRTLYQYRTFSLFPDPYKTTVKGKETNFYDPKWIKYIKRVQELKSKLNKTNLPLKDIRKLDEKFFKDIPLKKKKNNKSKKNKTV